MHSPKKKNPSSNTHQAEHVQLAPKALFYQQMDWGQYKKGDREERIKQPCYTMQRIIPLGSTVSITSMFYCIYRLILLFWV
ncbi:unnamed protein product [Staurois parvus]|uniref:Uncharacterized protein n=1 Tax=Staurois parvus TaxID=386267 RepID=A0ABN9HHM3_9NEOB|nr:unnamed protein product [Staurois parvus]